MPDKRMTPQERAEKLVCKCSLVDSWIPYISAEIQKAEAEIVVEVRKEAKLEGFNLAKEMAAKVALDHGKVKGAHIHAGFAFCVEQVASKIRTLQMPEGK